MFERTWAVNEGGRRAVVGALAVLALAAAPGCGDSSGEDAPCMPVSGNICTVAGTGIAGDGANDLPALQTKLYLPQDVTVGPDGRLFIVDWNNHRIRVLEPTGKLRIVAGAGELGLNSDDPSTDRLNHPTAVTFDKDGRMVIAAWHNSRIKVVDLANGDIVDTCGDGRRAFSGDGGPAAMASLDLPVGVVFDADWNLIIADQANQRLRQIDHDTGIIHTIAGRGPCPQDTTCVLGDEGPAAEASFAFPLGQAARPGGRVTIDAGGNLYVADTSHYRVRKIDRAGVITTFAGDGTLGTGGDGGPAVAAQLSRVADVAAGPDGSIYIADTENSCIRVVTPDGVIATAAGVCGQRGFEGDGAPARTARLDRPSGLTVDSAGNLFIADTQNHRIRIVYH